MKTNDISRREFLRRVGLGAAAVTAASIPGCSPSTQNKGPQGSETAEIPTDSMTTRHNPTTGDDVSLLGYGCMRWPTIEGDPDDKLDQEEINRLVDKAIAYGVNYFDTSPAYCKGRSEEATGIALSRHPRDNYYIATKLSNFSPSTWSREAGEQMYRNSLKNLRTDHIDYMLLHAVGMGGPDNLRSRYIDNGMLDFLLAEREARRIRNLGFSYHGDIEVFDHLLAENDRYR